MQNSLNPPPLAKQNSGPKFVVNTNTGTMVRKPTANPQMLQTQQIITSPTNMQAIAEEQTKAKKARPSSYIAKIQKSAIGKQAAGQEEQTALSARENIPSHFQRGQQSPLNSQQQQMQQMTVSQSAATLPAKMTSDLKTRMSQQQFAAHSQASTTMSVRPSTAATTSQVLSSMAGQNRRHKGVSITAGSVSNSNGRPMSASQRALQLQQRAAKTNNMSRQRQMEAQMAEENRKRQTVPQAPQFASDTRAKRRTIQSEFTSPARPSRKIYINSDQAVNPSLFTLQRARTRAEIFQRQVGETHRLDDPYTPGPKFHKPEYVEIKGRVRHEAKFNQFYTQKGSLRSSFTPSISTGKGGNVIQAGMTFKPTLYERPKTAKEREREREKAEDEADCSDNTVQRAYKKQQAHVEKLYWHEGDPGHASGRECVCVYGETRHYKRPKRIRYFSARRTAKSKEIWARLTRPKSAAVIRKRD